MCGMFFDCWGEVLIAAFEFHKIFLWWLEKVALVFVVFEFSCG
jgi:hypothetical protein